MTPDDIFTTLYAAYPALRVCEQDIAAAYDLLLTTAEQRALIMICGNGEVVAQKLELDSLSPAEQARFEAIEGGAEIAGKLQGAIRCVSLVSQVGVISAFANDIDPSLVYAQQVWGYASSPEDVLIALSTSGGSANVVNAAKTAKACGIKTLAITGEAESRLSALCDVTVKLPAHAPFEVQELTLPLYHALCAALEAALFEK